MTVSKSSASLRRSLFCLYIDGLSARYKGIPSNGVKTATNNTHITGHRIDLYLAEASLATRNSTLTYNRSKNQPNIYPPVEEVRKFLGSTTKVWSVLVTTSPLFMLPVFIVPEKKDVSSCAQAIVNIIIIKDITFSFYQS